MKDKRSNHHSGLTYKGKVNLVILICIIIYLFEIIISLSQKDFCEYLGTDYCAFWSAGRIMSERSIIDVYDQNILRLYEENVYPHQMESGSEFQISSIFYFPLFLLPFQVLSWLKLPYSYLVWTLINLVGYVIYLRFFIKDTTENTLPNTLLLLMIIMLPVFLNLIYGQVNIFLGICVGEFIRYMKKSQPIKGGLWLGGLLLKPQLLILIIPILFFKKNTKVLLGFVLASALVLSFSFCVVGIDGFVELSQIFIGASQGGGSSWPQAMMNWRMLGYYVEYFLGREAGWGVIIIGSSITALICLKYFVKNLRDETPCHLSVWLLGILAATCAVTWHAHLSMSIVLIPPLLFLVMERKMPLKFILSWVLLPICFYFSRYLFDLAGYFNLFPEIIYVILSFLEALPGLIFNLIFLNWSVHQLRMKKVGTSQNLIV